MTLGFPVNEGAALGAGYVIKKIDGMKAAATPHSTSSEGTDPVEDTVKMMVAFNGKTRFGIDFPADADNATIEAAAREHELTPKYLEGKQIVKVIIVPKRMINLVLK